KKAEIIILALLLLMSLITRILFADFITNDYLEFLSVWCKEYKAGSIGDAMRSNISNYMPAYNYFLILFSRTPLNDLYEIKLLSIIFEILTAFLIIKVASYVLKKPCSPIYFGAILLCGVFLTDSAVWAQCDSIYTFFGLLGFYYALKKKSIRSFICFGLSISFKMQALLLYPVVLVLLLNKEPKYLKWKDILVVPVVFVLVNIVPFFFGRSLWDIYSIYLKQSSTYPELSKNCANFAVFFSLFKKGQIGYYIALILLILLTLSYLVFIYYFVIKKLKANATLSINDFILIAFCFCFGVVFLMPKMLDRFLYFAIVFSIIYAIINKNNRSVLICLCLNVGVLTTFMQYLKTMPINIAPINALFATAAFFILMHEFYLQIIKNQANNNIISI
ncbi:MAG TPA: hypothetical protein VIL26_05965, partial [Clostridia bacterium]